MFWETMIWLMYLLWTAGAFWSGKFAVINSHPVSAVFLNILSNCINNIILLELSIMIK